MPLELLLTLVGFGIAGIALLLHLTGHSRPFAISDAQIARREWLRHFPDDSFRAAYLGGGAALIDSDQGIGLLRPFGADTVAHRVHDLTDLPKGVRLDFADFAAPPATILLDLPTRATWRAAWETRHG
jgi:hypothetical protein